MKLPRWMTSSGFDGRGLLVTIDMPLWVRTEPWCWVRILFPIVRQYPLRGSWLCGRWIAGMVWMYGMTRIAGERRVGH